MEALAAAQKRGSVMYVSRGYLGIRNLRDHMGHAIMGAATASNGYIVETK